jgi:tetratricopeptide (TPR) repeat protein
MRSHALSLASAAALSATLLCLPALAAPEAPSPKPDAGALVREGEGLYMKGAFAEALKRFEAAMSAGAESGSVLYEAGTCYGQAMGNKEKEVELKKRAVPLLEKEIAGGAAPLDTYYYLAAIDINDLADPVKGTDAAKKGVALLEKSGAPSPTTQVGLFRAGRLYSFLGKDKEAASYYDRSVQASTGAPAVDRISLVLALEGLSAYRFHDKEYDEAAKAYEALLKLDPLRDRDRHQLGLAYLMAGKPEEAATAWRAAQEDELRTELTYLSSVVRKYVAAGSPATSALAPKPAALSDDDLVQKILKAAEPLRAAREKEAKAQAEAEEKADKERAEKYAAERAAKPTDLATIKANVAKIRASKAPAPPPDPNVVEEPTNPTSALAQMGLHPVAAAPIPPPSLERIAAEKDFFFLMVEYVKRGHLIRNFCFENGLVEMVFR